MNSQETLPRLLALAVGGDRHSFGQFYQLHLNEKYRSLLLRVNDHDDEEDLTAKVFLEAWESQTGQKPGIQNIRAWIYRIARNKVIDYPRTRNTCMRSKITRIKSCKVRGWKAR